MGAHQPIQTALHFGSTLVAAALGAAISGLFPPSVALGAKLDHCRIRVVALMSKMATLITVQPSNYGSAIMEIRINNGSGIGVWLKETRRRRRAKLWCERRADTQVGQIVSKRH